MLPVRVCLPAGHPLPGSFSATGDLAAVVSTCEVVLMVVPTPFVARTLAAVADKFRPDCILVSCTKGILNDTLETREHTVCWEGGCLGTGGTLEGGGGQHRAWGTDRVGGGTPYCTVCAAVTCGCL